MAANYESDHTRFMRDWLEQHPEEIKIRRDGRALWWDKPAPDDEAARRLDEASVSRKAYYYDAN